MKCSSCRERDLIKKEGGKVTTSVAGGVHRALMEFALALADVHLRTNLPCTCNPESKGEGDGNSKTYQAV